MGVDQKELIERITDSGLIPPENLTLMITRGCNLNCPHCLLECDSVHQVQPVPANIIKRIIKEFADLDGRSICITGGEPLTHPDWIEILRYSCGFEDFDEVCMQTNAGLIKEDHIKKFLSFPSEKFVLQVSLDGANPETHDRLRGEGQFNKTLKTLRMMSEAGLGEQIRIAFTEISHNYDELPDLIGLVCDLGLKGLISGTVIKGGRSLKHEWINLPSVSQVISLIKRYEDDSVFRDNYEKVGKISAIEWFKGKNFATDQMCTCIKNLFIDAHGRLYPCIMYLNDSIAVHGIHDKSLFRAIDEILPEWAKLPKISHKRSAVLESCRDCPGRLHCQGGCLGRAYAMYGDVIMVEDRCDLRKAVYSLEPYEQEE
jgi:radical SAM protein with 4Fe4S-binding SPASM domain